MYVFDKSLIFNTFSIMKNVLITWLALTIGIIIYLTLTNLINPFLTRHFIIHFHNFDILDAIFFTGLGVYGHWRATKNKV